MILQALHDYYDRKSADPESGLAQPGFEWKEIPFIIELDARGNPIQIEDTRESEGKKKRARSFLVPQGVKRAVNVAANLLWTMPRMSWVSIPRGSQNALQSSAKPLLPESSHCPPRHGTMRACKPC